MIDPRNPRARLAMFVWSVFGLAGIAVALYSIVSLAGSSGLLPWHMPHVEVGRAFVRFAAGVSLSCMALWGAFKQTVHASEDLRG